MEITSPAELSQFLDTNLSKLKERKNTSNPVKLVLRSLVWLKRR